MGGSAYDRAYDIAATTNNEFYVAGVSRSFSPDDDLLVARITAAATVIWSKKIGASGAESIRKITPTSDGGVLITGQTKSFSNANGDILCMKLSSAGNIVWSSVFGVGSTYGDLGMDIIETTDGGYAVSGIINVHGFVADGVVIKLNGGGNVVWAKRYDRGDGEDGVGIVQKGDTLIVAADLQNSGSHYEFMLMKMKLSDGSFIMSKKFTPAARGLFNPYLFINPAQPGYLISGHSIDYDVYTNMNHTVIAVDDNFNVLRTSLITINPVTNEFYTGFAPLADGSWIGCASPQTNADGCLYRIGNDNSVIYSKRINDAAERRFYRLALSGAKGMAAGGAVISGQEDFYLSGFDVSTGISDNTCNSENVSLEVQQPTYSVNSFTWPSFNSVTFAGVTASLNVTTVLLEQTSLCPSLNFDFNYQFNTCDPLSVQFNGIGSDTQNPTWDFGDGSTVQGNLSPVHNFSSYGSYTVKYSVSNSTCTDTITKTIIVSVVPDDIIRTNDTTICFGSVKQLQTQPALSFCWSPTIYLDNPNSPNPITSAPQNITYFYTAEINGPNVIVNGDFSAGNSGFTSEYNYANPNVTEGEYYVGPSPQAWNAALSNCGDHTTGAGKMMLVNGSPVANVTVWKQVVPVTPNTNYAFSTWIQALWPPNPAQLQFSINGKDIGALITASLPTCTLTQFYTTWNSRTNTTAIISIVNKNTEIQGNDFALDDISFAPVFIKRDSVRIMVDNPIVKTSNDTSFCVGRQAQLNTTGASSYSWTPDAGLSNPSVANPIAIPTSTTQYIVAGTTARGCTARDTVNITVYPTPSISKSGDTLICNGSSAQLFADGGVIYNWSPSASLNDASVPDPVATPSASTTYFVIVTDANTCQNVDSVKVVIRPDPVFTITTSANVCANGSVQLNASGGNLYSWHPTGSLNDPFVANPTAFPQATTNYSVQITDTICKNSSTLNTTVTVVPLPIVRATKSNDLDCSNDVSQLMATGALTYSWTPANTLNDAQVANPVARPAVQTIYIVKGTDANGCVNYDSVAVNITALNKSGYDMPSAFTPNNDGRNDCYRIRYWGVIDELDFGIYNRWGERIFHTLNPTDCWDGTYKGVMQNPGVYVYIITAKTSCGKVFKKGTFALIR
ncbi:MAG TPA: gliding motility-associated C-terminal domain-containing protein [Chitinophagaceae bacterium]|nr:gliding motility-associated C-terminal domain-containing protein [Chitinophagaceae bacterium]